MGYDDQYGYSEPDPEDVREALEKELDEQATRIQELETQNEKLREAAQAVLKSHIQNGYFHPQPNDERFLCLIKPEELAKLKQALEDSE